MLPFIVKCFFVKTAATINKPIAPHVHHARRVGRAMKRAGKVAVSKPAIIGWTCLATGALVPTLFFAPAALPAAVNGSTGPVAVSPWAGTDVLPLPTGREITGPPVLLPDAPIAPASIAPPTLAPEVPTTPGQPVPEPGSLALLATALAGLCATYRVIKIRKDGVNLPRGCCRRSQFAARRTARLLAVTNADPEVDHFAVSDGMRVVFRTPAGSVER